MEWVKTTAKTVPEAIDLALDNLGVDESEAEIVILEEPRSGLFGRTRGTARVEARVKPKPIRPKNERNRGRKTRSDGGNRNRKRGRGSERHAGGDRSGDDRSRGGSAGADTRTGSRGGGGGRRSEGSRGGGRGGQGRSGGRDDGGRGRARTGGSKGGQQRNRSSNTSPTGSSEHGDTKPSEGASVEDVATHLRTFLTDLTDAFGLDGGVTIDDSEDGVLVGRIEGRHGLLVGPKGRTLDAVQELARISCQRAVPSDIRIRVDVGGYREQRTAALADFAQKAADRAVAEASEVALDPMSAADRKAVHDALNEDDRVETRSIGTDPRRRVLVVPLDVDEDEDDDDLDDLDEPVDSADDTDVGDSDSDEAVADDADDADDDADDEYEDPEPGVDEEE